MFSPEELEQLKQVLSQLKANEPELQKTDQNPNNKEHFLENKPLKAKKKSEPALCKTPAQMLVIAGLLTEFLEVHSITVKKDQVVTVVLTSSLKKKHCHLDSQED